MTPFNEITRYFDSAKKLALKEFERIVTDIVESDPKISGFISSTGFMNFYDNYGEAVHIDDLESTPNTVSLSNIIKDWDDIFKFSGHSFRVGDNSYERSINILDW